MITDTNMKLDMLRIDLKEKEDQLTKHKLKILYAQERIAKLQLAVMKLRKQIIQTEENKNGKPNKRN